MRRIVRASKSLSASDSLRLILRLIPNVLQNPQMNPMNDGI
jgi:hypothetical protein